MGNGKKFLSGNPDGRAGRKAGKSAIVANLFKTLRETVTRVLAEPNSVNSELSNLEACYRIVMAEDPARALDFARSLCPREVHIETRTEELPDEELELMIVRLREQLGKPNDQPLLIEARVNEVAATTEH
jgi:hypothetical protein